MALPTTLSFNGLLVQLGDGANPETFASPAGFTDKAYKTKIATGSTDVPDADNPDLPMWQEIESKTISAEITGSGVLALADLSMWRAWYISGAYKNIRVVISSTAANGGGYDEMQALLTDFEVTAKKGEKCAVSVTIESSGVITFVPAVA